jgi:hypothetical protein
VDSLLDRLEQKMKESGSVDGLTQGGFMTVTFLGYYDNKKFLVRLFCRQNLSEPSDP